MSTCPHLNKNNGKESAIFRFLPLYLLQICIFAPMTPTKKKKKSWCRHCWNVASPSYLSAIHLKSNTKEHFIFCLFLHNFFLLFLNLTPSFSSTISQRGSKAKVSPKKLCACVPGADPGFYKRGGAQIKDWQIFGACGDRGCLRGMCPLRSGENL